MADRPEFDMESMDDLGTPAQAEVVQDVPVEAPEMPVEAPVADQATQDPDTFPRDYVEELRRENAKYRTRAQQYEQAFDGYDDDTRQQLLTYFQLAKRAEAGDAEAAQELQQWLGDDDTDDVDDDDFTPMSRQEYEQFVREAAREEASRLLFERESHQQQIQAVDEVRSTAEGMGYDASSPDYILLLKFANEADPNEHPDLLAYAHEQVQAYHQSIVERTQGDYLAKKEQDNLTSPRVATPGSSPNLAAGPPKSFAEARARMDERLTNT